MALSILRPEELIRQAFIRFLEEKQVPRSLMIIEKTLKELPHLFEEASLPNRRVDLLLYQKKQGSLVPFLLVEVKASLLSDKALYQVAGYNHYVKSPYIALVSDKDLWIYDCRLNQRIQNHEAFFEDYLQA